MDEEMNNDISSKPIHEPLGERSIPDNVLDLERMAEETPRMAPLFIKVDKYKEVLESIQKLKLHLKNIQFLLSFKDQINKISTENDELLYKTVQNLSQSINNFSMNFSVPRSINYLPKPPTEERVDQTVSDLGDKISKLREELERIRV
jgi:hypothetical protein